MSLYSFKKESQFLVFTIYQKEYGINTSNISEVIQVPELKRLPDTLSFIKGVVELDHYIVPIIDFRERMGIRTSNHAMNVCLLIVSINSMRIGIAIDDTLQIMRVEERDITKLPPLAYIDRSVNELTYGTVKFDDRFIMLVDPHKLFSGNELSEIRRVSEPLLVS